MQFVGKVSAAEYTEYVDTLNGAQFAVRFPDDWNGGLVVLCRGWSPTNVTDIRTNAVMSSASAMLDQGFAIAGSTYGATGFCIQAGVNSTYELTMHLIGTYNITGKIFLYGRSMGGEIALLLGEKYPNIYSGVLDMFGGKDLKDQYETKARWANLTDEELSAELTALTIPMPAYMFPTLASVRAICASNIAQFELETGGTPTTHPQEYEDRSPVYHANITIPVITVHGTSDLLVPFYESVMYQTAVDNAGCSDLYRLYNVTGGQHGDDLVNAEVATRFAELVEWSDIVPEGLSVGVFMLLSSLAVIVSARYFRKRAK